MEEVVQIDSPSIKPINKNVVYRICSGQVILDLSSAVKELVENSLDAGATTLEIELKDYGEKSFKVSDNGCGISSNNFKVLALKHHTSKITDFSDLQSLTTFGFRGEALSSLCALGNLSVETRTKDEPMATHLTFDCSGLLISERKTARQVGTTVCVEKLFSSLPVRGKEFSRNIRREYGKLVSLLNAYALIAKGVRFVCTNTIGKSTKSVVLRTQGSSSIKDNIITVFGMNTFACLEPLNICISEQCRIEGFISKPGDRNGRNLGDRQFYFVNGRPVDMPKLSKLVNELYKSANSGQYPIVIINLAVPTKAYDVNVTPDKRKIFFSDEGSLMQSLREALERIYSPSHCGSSDNKLLKHKKENVSSKLSICCGELQAPLSSEGYVNKEEKPTGDQASIEHIEEDGIPRTRIKKHPRDEHERTTGDKNLKRKDFSLKVHTIGKIDNSHEYINKQLSTSTPAAKKRKNSSSPLKAISKGAIENVRSSSSPGFVQSSLTMFVPVNKRKHEEGRAVLSEVPVLRNEEHEDGSTTLLEMPVLKNEKLVNSCNALAKVPVLRNVEHKNSCTVFSEVPVFRNEAVHCQTSKVGSKMNAKVPVSLADCYQKNGSFAVNEAKISRCLVKAHEMKIPPSPGVSTVNGGYREENSGHPKKPILLADASSDALLEKDPQKILRVDKGVDTSKITSDAPSTLSPDSYLCTVLQFSMNNLKMSRQNLSRLRSNGLRCERTKVKSRCFAAATLELSQPENEHQKAKALAAATTELERFFNKEDFRRMKVIGQFDRGFIIGRLDKDLFIIDQHAADEKHNFEHLTQSTVLNQQPLIQPLRLGLSPEEEIVAIVHMDMLRKNGFTLIDDINAPSGHRIKLSAVPFSKHITFGAEDVKELISSLADGQGECTLASSYKLDTLDSVCPSRIRTMLASRACRSSIMAGDLLGEKEMQKILEHLAYLKSPWNCPHGRPTIRHLIDLTTIDKEQDLE